MAAGAEVVSRGKPHGKGANVTAAAEAALSVESPPRLVLLCDGDLGASAARLAPLVEAVRGGECDLAVAAFSRRVGGGFGFALGFARWAIRRRCGQRRRRRSPASGRCGSRCCAPPALRPGYGMEIGMTVDAVRAGYRLREYELDLEHRATGRRTSPASSTGLGSCATSRGSTGHGGSERRLVRCGDGRGRKRLAAVVVLSRRWSSALPRQCRAGRERQPLRQVRRRHRADDAAAPHERADRGPRRRDGGTLSGERPPALRHISIAINRGGVIETGACRPAGAGQIEASSSSRRWQPAPRALVGDGRYARRLRCPNRRLPTQRPDPRLQRGDRRASGRSSPTSTAPTRCRTAASSSSTSTGRAAPSGRSSPPPCPAALNRYGYLKGIGLDLHRECVYRGRAQLPDRRLRRPAGLHQRQLPLRRVGMTFADGRSWPPP